MSYYFERFISLLETNDDIKSTFSGARKQLFYAMSFGVIGAMIAGPLGVKIGTVFGAWYGADNYPSLITSLKNLDDSEKERLGKAIQKLVGSATEEALYAFILSGNNAAEILKILLESK